MRLLRVSDGGFVELHGKDISLYAILSHTWGPYEKDEYIFTDALTTTGKDKPGYRKVEFCLEQAQRDNLDYVWIDTCCINKDSSAELSEAINSMFGWYQGAAKCYVYLSDVSFSSKGKVDRDLCERDPWIDAFRKSRWFTRSWTLQELIAPESVEFFSCEGVLIGEKRQLHVDIHQVTGIPVEVLQDSHLPLSEFSVEERLDWARGREAKRDEDHVYSLLGLFDIHMPLLYGEGRPKALKRLKREICMDYHISSNTDEIPSLEVDTQTGTCPSPYDHSRGCNDSDLDTDKGFSASCQMPNFQDKRFKTEIKHRQHQQTSNATKNDLQPSCSVTNGAYGTQYTNFGGTQNNNTGSGKQFIGDFHGTVHFNLQYIE